MKRFFVVSLFSLLLLGLSYPLSFVHAQTPTPGPWYNQNPQQFHDRVFGTPTVPVPDNEIFGERYTYAQINWIFNSLANIFSLSISDTQSLIDLVHNLLHASAPPTFRDYAQLGLPGIFVGGIAEVYSHPPASGVDSIQSTLAHLNLARPVMAQGGAFQSLSAFQLLWSASRNTAYFVMVILLVAAGFLIMFRIKINPQTVVSLQLMIPKIIITLLLVTFSYAIAGLVIDLIYLVLAAAFAAFASAGIFPSLPGALRYFTGGNIGWIVIYFIVPMVLVFFLGTLLGVLGFVSPLSFLGALPGAIVAIITIILAIAVLWIMFKIWWMLMKTYLTLILLIIIGPWQIMLGVLPGQSGFGSWFRNLIAQASVFVAVPILIFFTMVLWSPFFNFMVTLANLPLISSSIIHDVFVPFGGPLQSGGGNYPILPLIGGGGSIFNFALGYVGLALTPKIAEIIRDAFKAPAFKYGSAIGQPIGFVINKPLTMGSNLAQARAKAPGITPEEAARNLNISSFLENFKIGK